MGYSRFDPAMQTRVAWNAGRSVGEQAATGAEEDLVDPLLS